ncbi:MULTISPECIES: hypothetical protein [Bacteroides]|uniref:hypothetical protein n=1 Tax=Bacteroides TaxID=816 RepID=UPI00264A48C7|nr:MULTISPECIES: hypothetical protein [Bacteroides]
MLLKKLVLVIALVVSSLSLWGGETGLFTYEGGFFVKAGTTWKEYRPKDKPGVWATYSQYTEEENYYKISNNNISLAIPKKSNNDFYKRVNGNWEVVYKTRIIYPSFFDSSVGLFCFSTGYYVRDGKKWRLYLSEKPNAIWASFDQYKEDDKFFYLKNDKDKVCVPKRADLNCFLWDKDKDEWLSNWSITEIYDHF